MNILSRICLILCTCQVVLGQFQLEPKNLTVLKGSIARFTTTVQGTWEVMTWRLKEFQVLTISASGNVIPSSPQFAARFCSSIATDCVQFSITNITRAEAGSITCTVQGAFGSKTSQLYVEESGSVDILGSDVMVKEDQQVELQCTATGWFPSPTITWTINGRTVDVSLYNSSSVAHGDSFNSTSVLTFQAVRNATVQCLATVTTLANPKSSSIFVVVEPKPPDWTVLIAIVVSFGGCALLVLLIIGIIFCCKRREKKQPSYEDEIRRVRTQSQLSGMSPVGRRQGQVNESYVTDGQAGLPDGRGNGVSYIQMPDFASEAGDGYRRAYDTIDDFGPRKHRHATMV